jgi:vacuolar protein sorting-associated protein 13A/C
MDGQVQAAAEESSYLGKLGKAIYENLRINVRNIHIRFEDTKVSRSDQAFNFGLLAESISYSMTNNRFQKAFLNIDDKLQEQKSFSLLLVSKFAMYWNSNAQDNWTKN